MQTRTNYIISQVAALYPFDANTITLINSDKYSPNDIYSFTKSGKEYILRIATHINSHLYKTIGEMEWLAFLHERGIPVSMPLPMKDGRLVESLMSNHGDKHHAVCAFKKAEGIHCDKDDPTTWNRHVIENWGYVMGSMHRETKEFQVSDPRFMRNEFDGGDIDGTNVLQKTFAQMPAIEKFANSLIPQLLTLPRTRDTWGLIHNDLHQANFLVKDNKVYAFDFDDSIYGYFALDIGITLHHALHNATGRADAEKIILQFMQGYKKANHLDDQALKSILPFMKYRQLCNLTWNYPDSATEDEQYNLLNGFVMKDCKLTEDIFM